MPLDENLPTFFLAKPNKDTILHPTFFLTRAGNPEPEPAYTLRYPDRETTKNRYAVALFDAFNPEILYGEILLEPAWAQPPSLSQDEVRKAGGIPPPPEPLIPHEYTVQLYNPDQQVHIIYKHGNSLLSSAHWDFSMPQDTFRTPSASMLDRARNDPGIATTTPRITFAWRKENKFTKDMTCYMTGKSTNIPGRKGRKEADITIAFFKGMKEITIYEPNLHRVEMEDPKGLEVVLLLTAASIREVYFGNIRQAFNISEVERRNASAPGPILHDHVASSPPLPASSPRTTPVSKPMSTGAAIGGLYTRPHAASAPPPTGTSVSAPTEYYARPPPTDARTQWELDNETQLLRRQVEAEERDQRRAEEMRRKRDEDEARRLRKKLEQEEHDQREARRLADEVETERLKSIYGVQGYEQQSPEHQSYTMYGALQQPHHSQSLPPPPPVLPQRYPPSQSQSYTHSHPHPQSQQQHQAQLYTSPQPQQAQFPPAPPPSSQQAGQGQGYGYGWPGAYGGASSASGGGGHGHGHGLSRELSSAW